MQKTVEIDGKKVRLESNAATPKKYKKQFHKDYFSELLKLAKAMGAGKAPEKSEPENQEEQETEEQKKAFDLSEVTYEDIQHIEMDLMYDIVWTLAKTADKTIPDPEEWLEQFEEFPLFEIWPEAEELISHTMNLKKKSIKHTPAALL